MKKTLSVILCLITAFLSACSVEISDLTPASADVPPPGLTLIAPTTALAASPVADLPSPTPALATPFNVPVTWAGLNLTGKLVYTAGVDGVAQLDLVSGAVTRLFQPPTPQGSFVSAQSVSPDGGMLVMAYTPPPSPGQVQYGYTGLYSLSLTGAGSIQTLQAVKDREAFFNPIWSADGQYIYYVHVSPVKGQEGAIQYVYNIERLAYRQADAGQPELVVENAFQPRLARDGSKLVYIAFDPTRPSNQLFVAAADGQTPKQIVLPDTFLAVDSPFFTPDGQAILFSGISAPAISWLDLLLGAQIVLANGATPADWWRVPVDGGQPEKLTDILNTSLYGNFSPDGRYVAYISGSGLYLMSPDGQTVTQVLKAEAIPGTVGAATVEWIP